MPATVHGDVQTDSSAGRKFITLKLGGKDRPVYRKLHLRIHDTLTARRRARAIEHGTDIAKVRETVAYLAASVSPREEKRRLAEVSGNQPVIPALSHESARRELESNVCNEEGLHYTACDARIRDPGPQTPSDYASLSRSAKVGLTVRRRSQPALRRPPSWPGQRGRCWDERIVAADRYGQLCRSSLFAQDSESASSLFRVGNPSQGGELEVQLSGGEVDHRLEIGAGAEASGFAFGGRDQSVEGLQRAVADP